MRKTFDKILKGILAFTLTFSCVATTACELLPEGLFSSGENSSSSAEETVKPEIALSKIEVTKMPNNVEYESGEIFSTEGMELTAIYSDGSRKVITEGYTYRPNGALRKSYNAIEVSYQNKKALIPITVVDKVIEGTTYTFEAEAAKLTGIVNANTYEGQELACYNIVDVAHASGGKMINNMNKAGNVISWTVHSDKATEANLFVDVAARCTKVSGVVVGWDVAFDEMYTTTINGEEVAFASMVAPKNGDGNATENGYYEICTVSTNIMLQEGENVIALMVGTAAKAGNLDNIHIKTEAVLADKTDGVKHSAGAWRESSKPTSIAEGLLTKGCTTCGKASSDETVVLPVLTSDTQFYTYELTKKATETETGLETYTYVKDGQAFTYTVALPKLSSDTTEAFAPQWIGSELFDKKNFFDPTHWTEGKQPELDSDGSIKVTSNARIDYLGKYLDGSKYSPAHSDTKHDILNGTEITYSMQVKSTGNFGVILFATSGATWTNGKNRGVFMEYNNGTITFRGANSKSGVGATSVLNNYSFTEYMRVDFVISRYVDTESSTRFAIKLYIGGQQVEMTGTNVNEEGGYTLKVNGFGGNIEFVSIDSSVMNINVPEESKYKAPTV